MRRSWSCSTPRATGKRPCVKYVIPHEGVYGRTPLKLAHPSELRIEGKTPTFGGGEGRPTLLQFEESTLIPTDSARALPLLRESVCQPDLPSGLTNFGNVTAFEGLAVDSSDRNSRYGDAGVLDPAECVFSMQYAAVSVKENDG